MTKIKVRLKQLEEFPEYLISECGMIFKKSSGDRVKEHVSSGGYPRVNLSKRGKGKTPMVHRLLAQTFIWNKDNKPCVNHKDGNKLNYKLENLEWCTHKENSIHAVKNGALIYKAPQPQHNFRARNFQNFKG